MMNFDLHKSIELLKRTPIVYKNLFFGLSSNWGMIDEGTNTWSAYDIIGHLIHGEKTDWIPRARLILSNQSQKTFSTFNRFAQQELSIGKTMDQLLEEFEKSRNENISILQSWNISKEDLKKEGLHPELGSVSLQQLIATWTIHDIGHLNQVSRVLVKHYKDDVGPWKAYSRILKD